MAELRAHLFFSYAHTDADRLLPFVEQLAFRLERAIWVDKEGIERGTAWEHSIKLAIDSSYGVIFALTQSSVKSAYILDKEIQWAYDRFKDEQGASLFVLLLDDAEIPKLLETPHITHLIDARDGDLERVIEELGKPGVLPEPRASGHPFLVNWQRLANFKGRDDALLKLHRTLIGESGRAGIKTVGAVGMGGIGKTQLAVEYAHRYRFYYPAGVYWINAAADWSHEVAECAEYLGLKPLDPNAPDRDGQLALAFEKYMQSQDSDALIVLDNVADPLEIAQRPIAARLTMQTLSNNTRTRLLLTTRVQNLPEGLTPVEIGVLTPTDARAALLDAWATKARVDNPDVAALDTLAAAVGYLPLALGWLAAALREIPNLMPDELLAELHASGIDAVAGQLREEGIDLGTPAYYEGIVGVALDWSLSRLKRPESHTLLTLIAAYGEAAGVPVERLRLLSGLQDKGIRRPFKGALDDLQAYSLVETLADELRLHPLTGDHIRKTSDVTGGLGLAAEKLTNAYRNPAILTEAVGLRRFAAVLDDIRATQRSLQQPNDELNELEWLLLRLEAYAVQPPEGVGASIPTDTFLIQQLRILAHDEYDNSLQDACDQWLANKLHLNTIQGMRYPADRTLLRTLVGHIAPVGGALELSDRRILSWSGDNTLRLWSSDGDQLRLLQGHSDSVSGALVVSDRNLLSWSRDSTLRIWSTEGEEVCTLKGHTNRIKGGLALSDGRILSWSDDHTLRIWGSDGAQLKILQGHTASISGVLVLSDGRFVSWSGDNTLRLWSHEGDHIRVLEGHIRPINGAQIISKRHILSWSADNTLRLWSSNGDILNSFHGHLSSISGAWMLPDGRVLSWSHDKTLRLWSTKGELLRTLYGHTREINGALALTDGRILSWSGDSTLRIWSTEGDELSILRGHNRPVIGAYNLPDGRILSWSKDNTLRLWSADGNSLRPLQGHTNGVNGATVLTDGRILSWSTDNTLRLWSIIKDDAHTSQGHAHSVKGILALSGGRLLSWSSGNTLRLWTTEGEVPRLLHGHLASVNGAMALPDARLLSWSDDKSLRLWSAEGSAIRPLQAHTASVMGALSLSDGRILSWSDDNTLRLWTANGDILRGDVLRPLEGHTNKVTGASTLPDGRFLSWSGDATLRLWSREGNALHVLEGHTDWVRGALILPDGRILSWSDDATLRLWSADGHATRSLEGHKFYVIGALILPDGRLLSWSDDTTLRLWSNNGDALRTLEGHKFYVIGAIPLPDGRLLSWSGDFTLRLWTSDGDALRSLQGHTNRVVGAFSLADGRLLSWSRDGSLRLWSPEGEALAVYVNGDAITTCIALGENRFVFGDARGRVVVVEVRG